jgi:hypothetical protein
MEKLIVVLDDAEHALQLMLPLRREGVRTEWLVLACPPRLTRHIGRWVNQASRNAWRDRWGQELRQRLEQTLLQPGDRLTMQLVKGPLQAQAERMLQAHPQARLLDARRPKLGQDLTPVQAGQPQPQHANWTLSGSAAAMGVALILAAD